MKVLEVVCDDDHVVVSGNYEDVMRVMASTVLAEELCAKGYECWELRARGKKIEVTDQQVLNFKNVRLNGTSEVNGKH